MTGLVTPCAFDQLHTASILGGFQASIKSSPPVSNRYITAGAGPFVGFFYALDVRSAHIFYFILKYRLYIFKDFGISIQPHIKRY